MKYNNNNNNKIYFKFIIECSRLCGNFMDTNLTPIIRKMENFDFTNVKENFYSFKTTRFDQLDFDKFCMLTNLARIFILPNFFLIIMVIQIYSKWLCKPKPSCLVI